MKGQAALMYHGIGNIQNKFDISLDDFKSQMLLIKKRDFQATSIEKRKDINNKKSCMITFDDGNKSDLIAAKILADYGYSSTFFIIGDVLNDNKGNYLTTNDLKKISNMGHSIGVHGKSHDWWTNIATDKLMNELRETKEFLEDVIGQKVVSCSPPGGKINLSIIEAIKETLDFDFIRNSHPKMNMLNDSLIINGVSIDQNCSLKKFTKILEGDCFTWSYMNAIFYGKTIFKTLLNK